VRSFHVAGAYAESVVHIVRDNISDESRLHTDESKLYHGVGQEFAAHETVKHSDYEYARGDVTTNTVEGYFSIFKRGMKGIYQHCSEKHLHRYLAEYDTATIIALRSATMTPTAPLRRSKVQKANDLHTVNLTKPNFKYQAKRFLRWRKRRANFR
jgi:ISXO2-like transposase domain